MAIDEAGHDPPPSGIDDRQVIPIAVEQVLWQGPDVRYAVDLDDYGLIEGRSVPRAVDQGRRGSTSLTAHGQTSKLKALPANASNPPMRRVELGTSV